MHSIEQTQKMMALLQEKLASELERMIEAFEKKDFTLLVESTNQLNLYGYRGYDLTVPLNRNARFKQKSRRDFMEMILADFEESGIEVVLPSSDGYSGEAIYFKAFGERLGVLYGEHGSVTGEVGKGNTEYLSYVLDGHKERYQAELEKVADYDKQLDVSQRLYDNPELVLSEEFREDRRASKSVLTFRFNNPKLQRVYEKFFASLIDRQVGKQVLKEMQTPENRKRHADRLVVLRQEKERLLQTMEQYLEKIQALEKQQPEFEKVSIAFFAVLEKYNIPYTGRND